MEIWSYLLIMVCNTYIAHVAVFLQRQKNVCMQTPYLYQHKTRSADMTCPFHMIKKETVLTNLPQQRFLVLQETITVKMPMKDLNHSFRKQGKSQKTYATLSEFLLLVKVRQLLVAKHQDSEASKE